MMKNRILNLLVVCFTLVFCVEQQTYAQSNKQKRADVDFETYAYINAIRIYERIADKGFMSASVLEKLGDSYYFNGKLIEANKWYNKLFNEDYPEKNIDKISHEYYYRFAQTQKAVNDLEGATQSLETFALLEKSDSRAKLFEKHKETYLAEIEKMSGRFELKNLDINTEFSDFGATIYDNKLIFTSARPIKKSSNALHDWTNENFTSLFETTIDSIGGFSPPILFSESLDSKNINESSAVFTSDGKTMFFTRNNSSSKGKQKYNKSNISLLKLYKATKQANGKWDNVVELPFNSDNFSCAHPALTPDDKWLYFVSNKEGGFGDSDLYKVAIYNDDTYGPLQNLGSDINTSGRETFPFISKEYILYFSSDGFPGLGGLDVFKSKINVDGTMGPVVNMGAPINSNHDDFSIYIEEKNNRGFVSSNRVGGLGGDDIYFFKEKLFYRTITGSIIDDLDSNVIKEAIVNLYDANYNVITTTKADSQGLFTLPDLLCGEKYRLRIEAPDYDVFEEVVYLDYSKDAKTFEIRLQPQNIVISVDDDLFKKLHLSPIYYDFNKSEIRPDAAVELAKVSEVLLEYPKVKISIRSHTDSRGNDDYNLKLSDRRAKATVEWLISQGIEKTRLKGEGLGETQLLNECENGVPCSEEEHQLNRRSEFIIIEL